jgi:ABC-type branched-subunit amino acid transport system substrate-binding protein
MLAAADSLAHPFLSPPQELGELGRFAHYRVVQLLGMGGMGLVFEAEDLQLQRTVALKVMKPEMAANAAARQRFLREARAMAAIHSDHIVTIHEVGEANGVPFLAMERLRGQPLDARLELGQTASPAQVLELGLQLAQGLEAAHRAGMIHRDIKPANIWLELPSGRVKILDFGLARAALVETRLTQTGLVMGTPAYMAPEQADGDRVDQRSDLFSLGCVLYEFAAGVRPFDGSSTLAVLKATALATPRPIREHNPAIPRALENVLLRLLAKKPADRPASAAEVFEALHALAGDSSTLRKSALAGGDSPRPAGPPGKSRRRLWIPAAAGGLLLALLAILAVVYLQAFHSGDAGSEGSSGKKRTRSTARGVSDNEILLGMSAPFSGPARDLGREMEVGIRAYLRHVNSQGGIAGRKITLITLDDGYEPDRALANMKELHDRHKVFAVIGNVGTPTAEKTLPYALQKKVLFFGAFTGAKLLRNDPPDRYVFNYRAGYEEETAGIMAYLVDVKKIRPQQVAVFAQEDGYGDAGFRGVARMVRKYKGDPEHILRVGHARNSVKVDKAVAEVLRHPEIRAVVMVSTYRPAARFIQRVKAARPAMIFTNVSFVGSDSLAEELTELGPKFAKGVIVTQVVPPIDSESSAVIKYREHLRTYYPSERPGFVSLEGYIDAVLFVEALRKAGEDLTTDTLIQALESIRDLDLGIGTKITFGPSEHQGSHKVWGTRLDPSGHYHSLELE